MKPFHETTPEERAGLTDDPKYKVNVYPCDWGTRYELDGVELDIGKDGYWAISSDTMTEGVAAGRDLKVLSALLKAAFKDLNP